MPPGVPRAGASQGREGTKTEPCPCARAVPTHHIWGPASRSTTALRERARVRGAAGAPQNPSCCRETPLSHLSPTITARSPPLCLPRQLCAIWVTPWGWPGPISAAPARGGRQSQGAAAPSVPPWLVRQQEVAAARRGGRGQVCTHAAGTTLAPSPGASSSRAASLPPALLSALGGRRHGDSLHAGLRCGREAGTPWSWSSQGCRLCSHHSPTHRPQIPA